MLYSIGYNLFNCNTSRQYTREKNVYYKIQDIATTKQIIQFDSKESNNNNRYIWHGGRKDTNGSKKEKVVEEEEIIPSSLVKIDSYLWKTVFTILDKLRMFPRNDNNWV